MKHTITPVLAALCLSALSACGSETKTDTATVAANSDHATLVDAIADTADLATVSAALKATGIASALEGKGTYTLLAPTDAAFATLGDKGKLLAQPDQQAASAAILRNHLLPGALNAKDIGAAIDAAGGKVTMRTMGSGSVTFSRDGDAIVVKGPDGAEAKLTDTAIAAGNGVALPVDGLISTI